MRQFLIIALIVIGVWLLRRGYRQISSKRQQHTRAQRSYQTMVRCEQCGLHVPMTKALGNPQQGYFCSEEHRRAAQAAKDNR